MREHRINHVVIVGGGTAGWMAAAALSRFLANGTTVITLIESEEIGTVGVGEATIPAIRRFNELLGMNEDEMLKATQGTFKLGIEFVDWGALGRRYFHPFGRYGRDLHGVDFHQLYLRERLRQTPLDLASYCVSAVAARHGRFMRPSPQYPERDLNYAFHFDATLYAGFLRRYAERGGVVRIEGRVVDVTLTAERGFVESVTLADGRRVAGELFIDCSGFRGLLIEQALRTGYENWSRWLPCDSALAMPSESVGSLPPFTRSIATTGGWQWRIPLQHRSGNGHVYSSQHIGDAEAEGILLANTAGKPLAQPRKLSFVAGRRLQAWNRNVVALGLAAGFVEPLESTSIHLIQQGIARLLALFPDQRFAPIERDNYNRFMQVNFEDVRDFIVLHYKLTERTDSRMWNECRTMSVPDSLQHKLDLFRTKGRYLPALEPVFGSTSWIAVMLGQQPFPSDYDPIVDALDEARVGLEMRRISTSIQAAVENMPTHEQFIARHCRASRPETLVA